MGRLCNPRTISSIAAGTLGSPPGANRAGLFGVLVDLRAGDSVVLLAVCFFTGDADLAFLLVAAIVVAVGQLARFLPPPSWPDSNFFWLMLLAYPSCSRLEVHPHMKVLKHVGARVEPRLSTRGNYNMFRNRISYPRNCKFESDPNHHEVVFLLEPPLISAIHLIACLWSGPCSVHQIRDDVREPSYKQWRCRDGNSH